MYEFSWKIISIHPVNPISRQATPVLINYYQLHMMSLDDGYDVRAIFFDISKAFNKVWHLRLLYKLKQTGMADNLLSTLINLLNNRK